MEKAAWIMDYDYMTDKCYQRPGCAECQAPVGFEPDDGQYRCFSCGKALDVSDPEMKQWFADRDGVKVEMQDCQKFEDEERGISFGCGGKGCVEAHYVRNPVTMKWRLAWSVCRECGQRTIV